MFSSMILMLFKLLVLVIVIHINQHQKYKHLRCMILDLIALFSSVQARAETMSMSKPVPCVDLFHIQIFHALNCILASLYVYFASHPPPLHVAFLHLHPLCIQ